MSSPALSEAPAAAARRLERCYRGIHEDLVVGFSSLCKGKAGTRPGFGDKSVLKCAQAVTCKGKRESLAYNPSLFPNLKKNK